MESLNTFTISGEILREHIHWDVSSKSVGVLVDLVLCYVPVAGQCLVHSAQHKCKIKTKPILPVSYTNKTHGMERREGAQSQSRYKPSLHGLGF